MKINSNADTITRLMARSANAFNTAQNQLLTGLKNPNPASDPTISTISRDMDISISTAKSLGNIAKQVSDTVELAWGVLRANGEIYKKMKDMAVMASNDTANSNDRQIMNQQFQQYISQADANARTKWGSKTLFDGTFFANCQSTSETFSAAEVVGTAVSNPTPLALGDLTINGFSVPGVASGSITDIVSAINTISAETGGVTATALTTASAPSSQTFIQPYATLTGSIAITYQGSTTNVNLGPFHGTETVDQAVNIAVKAINQAFEGTLLTASNINNTLQIVASDGGMLGISYFNLHSANIAGPIGDQNYYGNITLSSYGSINVSGNNASYAGFSPQLVSSDQSTITTVIFNDMRSSALLGGAVPNLLTQASARLAIGAVEIALNKIINETVRVSSYSIKFESIAEAMDTESINLLESLSTFQDSDFAERASESQRLMILQEAASATLKNSYEMSKNMAHLVGESIG